MIDLTGFRPFALDDFDRTLTPGMYKSDQLIRACQIKHLGFVDGRPNSAGVKALAHWLIEHRAFIATPKPSSHPLNCGTTIERVLAGDLLPEEDFAIDLAEMTEGAVLPQMFGLPTAAEPEISPSSASGASPLYPDADAASEPARLTPRGSAPAPSTDLPALGALGGALPPGRLFQPIADSRFPQGFVLTGCGLSLCLDESTANAMRAAIEAGLEHLQGQRAPRQVAA
ncbi:hypothetical protein [Sphingobium sp.]|uniref:hypothetical protein n=1 Tax=Sphingobium sp. TaxID=1912891 RepID=UPI003BB4CB02